MVGKEARRSDLGLAEAGEGGFSNAKITTARFFADHLLSQAPGLAHTVLKGGAGALAVPEEHL